MWGRSVRSALRPRNGFVEHTHLVSAHRRLDSVPHVQLRQDVADMGPNRGLADVQFPGDFVVRESAGQASEHVALPVGERVELRILASQPEPPTGEGLYNAA